MYRDLLHLNKAAIIKSRPPKAGIIKGKKYQFKRCYIVRIIHSKLNPTINHGHSKAQDGQIELVTQYTGNVYGITLVKNNILYTRRNGKCHWSGNSGMYGQKGIITQIIPDDEMPRTADGEIVEVIQNPSAVPSRMNIGQIIETAASKIAKKTGQPFYVRNYVDDTSPQAIEKTIKRLGISAESTLYDKDGKPIADGVPIFEGYQYFVKLKQQSKKYLQYRNADDPYDIISRRPSRGPKMGALGFYALLAHGATGLLKEMGGIKSELNDNWWRAFETGQPLPKPKTTFAFDKLMHFLTAAGMAVKQEQDGIRIMPLTDADVDNSHAAR
jgi:DNA-directed RNA polymerase subunit beta